MIGYPASFASALCFTKCPEASELSLQSAVERMIKTIGPNRGEPLSDSFCREGIQPGKGKLERTSGHEGRELDVTAHLCRLQLQLLELWRGKVVMALLRHRRCLFRPPPPF